MGTTRLEINILRTNNFFFAFEFFSVEKFLLPWKSVVTKSEICRKAENSKLWSISLINIQPNSRVCGRDQRAPPGQRQCRWCVGWLPLCSTGWGPGVATPSPRDGCGCHRSWNWLQRTHGVNYYTQPSEIRTACDIRTPNGPKCLFLKAIYTLNWGHQK
jgi:hypothetical protein